MYVWCVGGSSFGGTGCGMGGFESICPYYLSQGCIVLPIEFNYISLLKDIDRIRIEFKIAMIDDASSFLVERSTNGTIYEKVQIVKGIEGENVYVVYDPRINNNVQYYRIRKIDHNHVLSEDPIGFGSITIFDYEPQILYVYHIMGYKVASGTTEEIERLKRHLPVGIYVVTSEDRVVNYKIAVSGI